MGFKGSNLIDSILSNCYNKKQDKKSFFEDILLKIMFEL